MSKFDISSYLSAFSDLIRAAGNTDDLIDKEFCDGIKKLGVILGIFKAELSSEAPDLRKNENAALAAFISEAMSENTGLHEISAVRI